MFQVLQRAAALGAALFLLFPPLGAGPVCAQDVTLRSHNGGVELSGMLQSYDGEFYQIDTDFGVLTLAAEGVACAGPGCPDLTAHVAEFVIAGSETVGRRLIPALIADFAAEQGLLLHVEAETGTGPKFTLADAETHQPVIRIWLHLKNSDAGLIALLDGRADLALSLNELRDPAVNARVVALDALLPLVGRGNPVARLTLPELAAVLSGEVDTWAALGWMEAPVNLHVRDAAAGVQQALEAQLLAPQGLPLVPGAIRHGDDSGLLQAISRDPFAIGLVLFSHGLEDQALPLVDGCEMVLVANAMSIKTEDYPLTLPVILHARAGRLPLQVRRFLLHATGASGQAAVRDAGFVDLRVHQQPLSAQGLRIANAVRAASGDEGLDELQRLLAVMEGTARLSLSFRFESGTTELDVQSRSNIDLLARDIEAGIHDGRELILAGFTDGEGQLAANQRLSLARAEAILDALAEAAPLRNDDAVVLRAEGFGPAMPLACDDDDWGQQVNRRVEVWLR